MKNHKLAAIIVTAYMVIYVVLFQLDAPFSLLSIMFAISPILIIWMAYTILRYGSYDSRELREDEEWGYQDKPLNWGKNRS